MLHIVLHQPEIPPNTGNIARLCLAAGARLHLVRPLGFSLDEKALRRAGMDYWSQVDLRVWDTLDECRAADPDARWFYLTTKSRRAYWTETFRDGDYLVFGRESRGLPESLLAQHPESCLTIPMRHAARSLNLASAASIVLYEALRQTEGGSTLFSLAEDDGTGKID